MQIAGLQKVTLIDFPGTVACTVFTPGCPFRCGFCHNPELVLPDQFYPPIDEVQFNDFLDKRIGKVQGICITGGEPLLQPDILSFIAYLKEKGFKVKVDTNGFFPSKLELVLRLVDYVAMDIKAPAEKYNQVTNSSIDIEKIKESIDLILNSNIKYEFRTTVMKPYLNPEDFIKIGELIKGAKKYIIQNYVFSKQISEEIFTSFTEQELSLSLNNIKPFVASAMIR